MSTTERSPSPPSASFITPIALAGNLLLTISTTRPQLFSRTYRVSTTALTSASPFFAALLHPSKFAEGRTVAEILANLPSSLGDMDLAQLPRVHVEDVGRISAVNDVGALIGDFLRIMHGEELDKPTMPVANLANLVAVADRFEALDALREWAERRKVVESMERRQVVKAAHTKSARGKAGPETLSEERLRQRVLAGLTLGYSPWVGTYSKQLILGPMTRREREAENEEAALWWDLPSGIEDEIHVRRTYILDTLASIQSYFLKRYMSGERQCRLGYDTSAACDSFQLGEMVRFFGRTGLLRMSSTLLSASDADSDAGGTEYTGSISAIIEQLKQCPGYQIDPNHKYCGLRSKLSPLLSTFASMFKPNYRAGNVGICGDCWEKYRQRYAWGRAKRPVTWAMETANDGERKGYGYDYGETSCLNGHLPARDMFMAAIRDWTDVELAQTGWSTTPFLRV
ncbi:hypothetical protein EJ06DRAFT_540031 [Trichodelitschia bisporula]|uniref:BTB domain-containing protein n=1 Tax=Trichodelitschia bisporula TaxID=703511 RepID=A0A6G1HKE6_9PEZI|nr:hypothetical protein EJ06DRAFT_540031 [Trichodelitschia bisporula]